MGRDVPALLEQHVRLGLYMSDELDILGLGVAYSMLVPPSPHAPITIRFINIRQGFLVAAPEIQLPLNLNNWCEIYDLWTAVQVLFGTVPHACRLGPFETGPGQ